MNPGRELDALVATKIMGLDPTWFNAKTASYYEIASDGPRLKPYSTDIAAAWRVVDRIADQDDWRVHLHTDAIGWFACFIRDNGDGGTTQFKGEADTAPHAICLAALRAVNAL